MGRTRERVSEGKGLRGERGERISTGKGGKGSEDLGWGKRLRGGRAGEDLNKEKERGEKILGRKRGKIAKRKKALGGKEGKDLNRERGKTS